MVHSSFQHDIEKEAQNRFMRNKYAFDFATIVIFYAEYCHKVDILLYVFPKIAALRREGA